MLHFVQRCVHSRFEFVFGAFSLFLLTRKAQEHIHNHGARDRPLPTYFALVK